MAKDEKSIFTLLTEVPWWVSLVVAFFIYLTLKFYIPSIEFKSAVFNIFSNEFGNRAHIVALLFLIPAPFAFLKSWRKKEQLDSQKNIHSIRSLGWKQFEELLGEVYRRQGYSVTENSGVGADGGIDLILRKDCHVHLVQCKQWKTQKIGVKVIREMYGLLIAESASRAVVVTSGGFTGEAIDFAAGKPIDLIDGKKLEQLVVGVQVAGKANPVRGQSKAGDESMTCAKCGSVLVLRTAKQGTNAGNKFYGCSRFPKCRYIENV